MAIITIVPMSPEDWPAVRHIYGEGIATGDATLEREAPDWHHFDHSHPQECRLVAREGRRGPVVGWTALGGYSARKVYSGVAWESVYVAAGARVRPRDDRLGERAGDVARPLVRCSPRPGGYHHASLRGRAAPTR